MPSYKVYGAKACTRSVTHLSSFGCKAKVTRPNIMIHLADVRVFLVRKSNCSRWCYLMQRGSRFLSLLSEGCNSMGRHCDINRAEYSVHHVSDHDFCHAYTRDSCVLQFLDILLMLLSNNTHGTIACEGQNVEVGQSTVLVSG